MATQSTPEDAQALSNQVGNLLFGYERFTLQHDVPGFAGYVMQLRTAVMVHKRYTKKGTFRPHEVYQVSSLTDLPSLEFVKAWLPHARELAEKHINKGEASEEKIVNGEWHNIKYKYNQWIYYDHKNTATIGQVQVIDLQPSDLDANTRQAEAQS